MGAMQLAILLLTTFASVGAATDTSIRGLKGSDCKQVCMNLLMDGSSHGNRFDTFGMNIKFSMASSYSYTSNEVYDEFFHEKQGPTFRESKRKEPDETVQGSNMLLSFDCPLLKLLSIEFMDVEASDKMTFDIYMQGDNEPTIQRIIDFKGDDSIQTEEFGDALNVVGVRIKASTSFGVRSICFCPGDCEEMGQEPSSPPSSSNKSGPMPPSSGSKKSGPVPTAPTAPPSSNSAPAAAPSPVPTTLPGAPTIIGGTPAGIGDYPYFADWQNCGGSLIHEDIVLTAAHCNDEDRSDETEVYVGAHEEGTVSGIAELRHIVDRAFHPNQDVMVLKLDKPSNLDTIELNDLEDQPTVDEDLVVIGNGLTEPFGQESSFELLWATVRRRSDEDCVRAVGGSPETLLCTGEEREEEGPCHFDSGGPLLEKRGNGYVEVGVVSGGLRGCPPGSPDYYVRVSGVKDWIDEQICLLSDNPPRTCPPRRWVRVSTVEELEDAIESATGPGTTWISASVSGAGFYTPYFLKSPIDVTGKQFIVVCADCIIDGKEAKGGLFTSTGPSDYNIEFEGVIFQNGQEGDPGALTLFGSEKSRAVFRDCVFRDNRNSHGAMYLKDGTTTFENCKFLYNAAQEEKGGAIQQLGGQSDFKSCRFAYNSAAGGGGAIHQEDGSSTFDDCEFWYNVAGNVQAGGAVSLDDGYMRLSDCRFLGNTAEGNGGALYLKENNEEYPRSSINLSSCSFYNNEAAASGGAIYQDAYFGATFARCDFLGNKAGKSGGAIYQSRDSHSGLTWCNFRNNVAESGSGGAIYQNNVGSCDFYQCEFRYNKAKDGGALRQVSSIAVYVQFSLFVGNIATAGAGGGGAIHQTSGTEIIRSAIFRDNKAEGNGSFGGALLLNGNGDVQLDGRVFEGNVAQIGSNIYAAPGTSIICYATATEFPDIGFVIRGENIDCPAEK